MVLVEVPYAISLGRRCFFQQTTYEAVQLTHVSHFTSLLLFIYVLVASTVLLTEDAGYH
jgi:hypothetical protein